MNFTSAFQAAMKRQDNKGRCLHFEDDVRCNEIISAHSIQKKGQLHSIAESGHVYRLNADLSTLIENGGKPQLKKVGLNRASTFPGMCKYHDNKLFAPIDDRKLSFDLEQIGLYAYRSICREYFVKENASITSAKMSGHPGLSAQGLMALQICAYGQSLGFERLKRHKHIYDAALASGAFTGFKFMSFESTSRCSVQASGLLFPDFDFQGGLLQDLALFKEPMDLLTFFTAPTEKGWAFVFAWHESSDRACGQLMYSLAKSGGEGAQLPDILLRFCLMCCENHAIRISWWDGLPFSEKARALELMAYMGDTSEGVRSNYLVAGYEGLADWSFDYVKDRMSDRM